ncbi:MAG: GNAT family N-acetyltransferase [Chloroflexi bacterium]|nr:GNAT family N-acetyltransferase [Chloroflexota bacterium]
MACASPAGRTPDRRGRGTARGRRDRVEVGFAIDPAYRRRGLATEALTAVFDWVTARHGVTRVTALVAPQDDRAVRLASRLTFREVGPELEEVEGLELVLETDWPTG